MAAATINFKTTASHLPPQVLWSMSCSPGVQSHSKPITMSLQMWEQPPLLRRHSFTSGEDKESRVSPKLNRIFKNVATEIILLNAKSCKLVFKMAWEEVMTQPGATVFSWRNVQHCFKVHMISCASATDIFCFTTLTTGFLLCPYSYSTILGITLSHKLLRDKRATNLVKLMTKFYVVKFQHFME